MSCAPRVLLADDCADALDVIEGEFRDAGFETARALDGRLAWQCFQERTPDLVVSDVRMPEIDGFDLLKKIRDVSDLPVILLTAYGEISLAVSAIRSGADDYLRFPDDLSRLIERARDLLSRNPEDAFDPATVLLSGPSKAARELRARVRALGALQIPVLVCGEHGTGRARVVRALPVPCSPHTSTGIWSAPSARTRARSSRAALLVPERSRVAGSVTSSGLRLSRSRARSISRPTSSGKRR